MWEIMNGGNNVDIKRRAGLGYEHREILAGVEVTVRTCHFSAFRRMRPRVTQSLRAVWAIWQDLLSR